VEEQESLSQTEQTRKTIFQAKEKVYRRPTDHCIFMKFALALKQE
jgi:hypothetical protein